MEFSLWLDPDQTRCFYENLVEHTLIIITAKPKTLPLTRLTVHHRSIVLFDETSEREIRTAFTAASSGDYVICVENKGSQAASMPLHIQVGPEAKDYTELAKKEHLDPSITALRKVEDELQSYHRNVLFMRSREGHMERLHKSTSSRIVLFCCVNLVVMLGATVIHVWHIRNFFRSKKII